jgi:5-methylthioadenosine/S-adenosylhomocysteine deaminase
MRLRARWVLPVPSPPIEDGEVVVEGEHIVEIRPAPADGRAAPDCADLGDSIIMPGLINAHSHVEYTVMRGLLDDLPFFPWLRALNDLKSALDPDDWVASAVAGAAEAVAGGVTTLADCTDSGAALDGILAVGARGVIYQEAFGMDDTVTDAEVLRRLDGAVRAHRLRADPGLHVIGVSPHSVYTVRPSRFRRLADYAHREGLPMCIHAAESQAEVELVLRGSGEIADRIRERGIPWDPPRSSVLAYLDDLGALGPDTVLAHGVNLSRADRARMHPSRVAWAHCPRSNAKLGVGVAPLGWLLSGTGGAAPRVGLGSDSVAGVNCMDMFEEMRFGLMMQRGVRREAARPTARDMVALATIGGARALGLDGKAGALEAGLAADLTVLSVRAARYRPLHSIWSAVALAGSARDIVLTMVGGRVVYKAGVVRGTGLSGATRRLRSAARRLRDALARLQAHGDVLGGG